MLVEEIDRSNQVKGRKKILSNESMYTKDRCKVAGKRVIKLETGFLVFFFLGNIQTKTSQKHITTRNVPKL